MYGNLLFMFVEEMCVKKDCMLMLVVDVMMCFCGVCIFDISNIFVPVQVGGV